MDHISKSFGSKKAVNNLSLDIKPGHIVGFIGPNGAGKTTTLKMMTGILTPDSGNVYYNDISIIDNALEAKKMFGYISDNPNSFSKLKGIEYINFIASMYGVEPTLVKQRAIEYSKMLEMENNLNQQISSYSHGMRQKIMIIAELVHDPMVLILDEPLTGLDPQSTYVLKELMKKRASEGKTVFFSTHVLEVAEKLCTQIAIINKGNIVYEGTLNDLKEQHTDKDSLEAIFLEVIKQ